MSCHQLYSSRCGVCLVCLLTLACGAKRTADMKEAKHPVPPFQIKITILEAAAKKLHDAGETIAGRVFFDGDGTSKKDEYTAPNRAVILGYYEFQTPGGGIVSVSDAFVLEEASRRLSDKDYYCTVNVFSAGHAIKDNILDCGFAEIHLSQAVERPIEITCKLIGE